jgi:GTP-binding protein
MLNNPYKLAQFIKSGAKLRDMGEDVGYEVAFVGRSNAGKSSALNTLTSQRQLARVSKTPGRTQLMNIFALDEDRRLIDLPGYGYAKVPEQLKINWQVHLSDYLTNRQCLKGLVLLMDVRHPLKDLDTKMVEFALSRSVPVHILLTKSDKLGFGQAKQVLLKVQNHFKKHESLVSVQLFSSLKHEGIDALIMKLNAWFQWQVV